MNLNPLTAIVIDDEPDARHILCALLADFCPQVQVLAQADNLLDGIAAIRQHQPALVFLDVEMPQHKGTEIARLYGEEPMRFELVFTTAYSQYAVQAFELSACDYLLKPIEIQRLQHAVGKAAQRRDLHSYQARYAVLESNLQRPEAPSRLCIPQVDGMKVVETERIICLKADSNYTELVLDKNQRIVASKTLKEFEGLLAHPDFHRCHRSYIVNLRFVVRFDRTDGLLELRNGDTLSVARDRRAGLIEALEGLR